MSTKRRKFTDEFKADAVQLVVQGGRPIAQVARELDMGGTWVHWIQPHVWAEITRYGLDLTPAPNSTPAYWRGGDNVRTGTADGMLNLLDASMTEVLAEGRRALP